MGEWLTYVDAVYVWVRKMIGSEACKYLSFKGERYLFWFCVDRNWLLSLLVELLRCKSREPHIRNFLRLSLRGKLLKILLEDLSQINCIRLPWVDTVDHIEPIFAHSICATMLSRKTSKNKVHKDSPKTWDNWLLELHGLEFFCVPDFIKKRLELFSCWLLRCETLGFFWYSNLLEKGSFWHRNNAIARDFSFQYSILHPDPFESSI